MTGYEKELRKTVDDLWTWEKKNCDLIAQAQELGKRLEQYGLQHTANFLNKETLAFVYGLTFVLDVATDEAQREIDRENA